jgi:nucleotide-sensitive chloride channel 1A
MLRTVISDNDEKCDGALNLAEDESLDYSLENVEVSFSKRQSRGIATVCITSKRAFLLFKNEMFEFDPHFIVLHAITRDASSYPKPCLYCQLGYGSEDDGDCDKNVEDGDSDGNGECIDVVPTEIFLAPQLESSLKELFDAFSKLALLNPDDDDDDGADDDAELVFNVDEVTLGAEQARALAHLESVFIAPLGLEVDQFADA